MPLKEKDPEPSTLDRSALLKQALEEGIVGVRTTMVNACGIVRGHVFPTKRFFTSVLEKGSQLAVSYAIYDPHNFCHTGLPPNTFGAIGTVNWRPDLSSLKPLPYHPKNWWIAADIHTDDGQPWECCARSILKRQLAKLKERHNAELVAGPEFEFHMFEEFDETTGMPKVWATYQVAELLGLMGKPGKVMDEICATLTAAGIELNNWHDEGGNIQWEFSLAPYEALKQADNIAYTRIAVKNVANDYGYKLTMCPKPLGPAEIGNGGHLHFSLRDVLSQENVFVDEKDPTGISELGQMFMAGVLEHLPAITAIILPTEMSYARTVAGWWAGAFACWGKENKEASLRVCAPNGKVSNVELKLVDSTSNPYLVMAVIVAAGLDGIERKLQLPPETTVDPASLSEEVRLKNKVIKIPDSIEEACAALEKDAVITAALGERFAEIYRITAQFNAAHMRQISDKERYHIYCTKY